MFRTVGLSYSGWKIKLGHIDGNRLVHVHLLSPATCVEKLMMENESLHVQACGKKKQIADYSVTMVFLIFLRFLVQLVRYIMLR